MIAQPPVGSAVRTSSKAMPWRDRCDSRKAPSPSAPIAPMTTTSHPCARIARAAFIAVPPARLMPDTTSSPPNDTTKSTIRSPMMNARRAGSLTRPLRSCPPQLLPFGARQVEPFRAPFLIDVLRLARAAGYAKRVVLDVDHRGRRFGVDENRAVGEDVIEHADLDAIGVLRLQGAQTGQRDARAALLLLDVERARETKPRQLDGTAGRPARQK